MPPLKIVFDLFHVKFKTSAIIMNVKRQDKQDIELDSDDLQTFIIIIYNVNYYKIKTDNLILNL